MQRLDLLQMYVDPQPNSAALNMAIDEALLERAVNVSLRFYRWRRPSLSFGYFSRFGDVEQYEMGRDLVRRWTGGGIVLHGEDITYSVIVPASHAFFQRSSLEIYAIIHDAIREVLSINGIAATLANDPSPKISDACFANPVRADVLVAGTKIAGAAQRRTRAGLLHQGSIQFDLPLANFHDACATALSVRFERGALSGDVLTRASLLAREKYGTPAWLRRR